MSIAEIFETMEYGPAPESTAPAEGWLEERGRTLQHFVAGEWREPEGGDYFETINPANGRVLARVAQGGAADVDAAVEAARAALPGWQALGPHGRARHLYALARHVQRRSRLLSVLESLDNGKPIRESRDIDVPLVARHFYHHAGWAQLMGSEFADSVPVGVVGQIIPWNFPLLMLAWKIAPALATGNTVVLKPAESTPLTALLFAEICRDAGLPAGVVNIVTGDGRTGDRIVRHPGIAKIAFTGSTEVGRMIRVATAGTGKKLSLELGGKSPFLVFEDADLDSVVEGVVDAIWFNQGQVCCAGSRILAQEGIAERLVAKLRAKMETLRIGDPLDKAVDIGAINSPEQLRKIRELVRQGQDEGGTLWQPSWALSPQGEEPSWALSPQGEDGSFPPQGCFFPPTLFTGVAPSSTVAQVEIFGPVVVLMTFRTPAEAVGLANNTPYGLAASVWTESVNLALDIAPKLKAGTVWVNSSNLFDAAAGFGGYRESGFGREGGKEGLWEYLRPRWEVDAEPGRAEAPTPERPPRPASSPAARGGPVLPPVDRTAKLYVGGAQVRPDSGYALPVHAPDGRLLGEVGAGNRKDVRNAVEAAHKAAKWGRATGHNRAQVLYYLAENLAVRADEFARRIATMTGDGTRAEREVELSIRRLYTYAAWADKYDGAVHSVPFRNVTLAMHEPIGVMGIVCPEAAPLLGFVSTVIPPVAMGNAVVAVPSQRWPLAATDFYQLLDTSDVPGGVINIVTGERDELAATLAGHDDVQAVWHFGSPEGSEAVERLSAGNMKRTWAAHGRERDWFDEEQGEGPEFLRQSVQVKNVWVPYGE